MLSGTYKVGIYFVKVHLRRRRESKKLGRVVFLVENEALAFQQGKEISECLPSCRTKVFSGSVHTDKKQYLWDFLERYKKTHIIKISKYTHVFVS